MGKYLYGAAVQGIQSFIFQTNKLQEIVGASELVEEICSEFFKNQLKVLGITHSDDNLLMGAAGNIKYIFENKKDCEKVVRNFPKAVMEFAQGITISQAVVEFKEGTLNDSLQKLEKKLREQRNKVSIPFEVGFTGAERARRSGGVAYIRRKKRNEENEFIDEATHLKRKKGDPYYAENSKDADKQTLFRKISGLSAAEYDFKKDLLFNIDDLKGSWMAVVHADGNGLGAILQNLNGALNTKIDEDVKNAFKQFSNALEVSTKEAAQFAFKETIKKHHDEVYPIRPIVLGGDDLTIIVRADLALEFTQKFLKEFENQTKTKFNFLENYGITEFRNGLTACAGIAYVKKSYPFHYAVDLAEKLCSDAKNFVKGKTDEYKNHHPIINGLVPKSALAFFKVQDSFIESSLSDMKRRVANTNGYDFNYGPYLISPEEDFADVNQLIEKLTVVEEYEDKHAKEESKGISKLRQWITEVYKDKTTSDFFLDRMEIVNSEFYKKMKIEEERKKKKTIIGDVVLLNTLKN